MAELDPIEAIRMVDQLFVDVLEGYPVELRAVQPRPGEWSAAEVLAHDWAIESRYLPQIRAAVEGREFTLQASVGGLQPDTSPPWETLITEYLAIRSEEIELLRSLPRPEWHRTWDHWTFGAIDVHWLARRARQHTMDGAQQCLMALNLLTCGNHDRFQSPPPED